MLFWSLRRNGLSRDFRVIMSEDEQDLDSLDMESEADDDGGQDLG